MFRNGLTSETAESIGMFHSFTRKFTFFCSICSQTKNGYEIEQFICCGIHNCRSCIDLYGSQEQPTTKCPYCRAPHPKLLITNKTLLEVWKEFHPWRSYNENFDFRCNRTSTPTFYRNREFRNFCKEPWCQE